MAGSQWSGITVVEVLKHKQIKACSEVFQSLRLLEASAEKEGTYHKTIKMTCSDSMSFPSSDFLILEESNDHITIELNFMGLFGVDGCLPSFFNDALHDESMNAQRLKDFLNIFHHHIHMLLYKAWKSQRPDISLELGNTVWLSFLSNLVPRMDVQHDPIELGEHLIGHRRTRLSLEKMLSTLFPLYQIDIQTMQPVWHCLNNDNTLGQFDMTLGDNTFLGGHYLTASQSINVHFGEMAYEAFLTLKQSKECILSLIHRYLDIFQKITLSVLVIYSDNHWLLGLSSCALGVNTCLGEKNVVVRQFL